MLKPEERKRVTVVAAMIGGILCLHYFTFPGMKHYHAVYQTLFYLPLVLGSFWFGFKGAIGTSLSVSIFYLPYVITQWQGFSFEDFDKILAVLLYIVIAFVLGYLVEKARRNQKELVGVERLAAIGRALSEVAHDMKTPLVAIGGMANQVHRKLEQDDPSRRKLEVVIEETARLESMVNGMLDFGRSIELRQHNRSLNELVEESLEVAQPMAKRSHVELKMDLDRSLPALPLDASRVKQVILNLITNAVQATPSGEEIWVRTNLDKDRVVLEVTDHGCGITEENWESIFKPFVSTKKGGSGLGLAIVKKIVEAHGGKVSFRPNSEKGVTFSIQFPIQKQNGAHGCKERLSW